MATSANLAELVQRHRMLEDELSEALQHPSADDFILAELKRRKLQLKDEITRLARSGTLNRIPTIVLSRQKDRAFPNSVASRT
jgi:hypothetical protein